MSVLIFDIPRDSNTVEKRINRELRRMDAKMIQHSVWQLDDVQDLMKVALEIKQSGGKARILEERFIF
ncbi:hypothetical protein EPN87_03315 [archaeon]|nr:MAG: hypothetical protein EPN87_03315 [archaeon]